MKVWTFRILASFWAAGLIIFLPAASRAGDYPILKNPDYDKYVKAVCCETGKRTNSLLVDIPDLSDEDQERLYQFLRSKISDSPDILQIGLLDYPRLRLLRNEIYARHGYKFESADLQDYFKTLKLASEVEPFSQDALSKTELSNIDLFKRLEYLKYSNDIHIDDFFEGQPKLKNFKGENENISVVEGSLIFKQSGKIEPLSKRYCENPYDKKNKELCGFDSVETVVGVPLVFKINYSHDFLTTGDNYANGIKIFNLDGDIVSDSVKAAGHITYIEKLRLFIGYENRGCCGEIDEDIVVFDTKGKMLLSSEGLYDWRIYKPLWSEDIVLFIHGENSASNDANLKSFDRIAVLNKNGVISDIKLPDNSSFEWMESDVSLLQKIVLLTPGVLYLNFSDGKQKFLLLNNELENSPSIGELYRYKDLQNYDGAKLKNKLLPIRNPEVIWKMNTNPTLRPPVITDKHIILFEPQDNKDNLHTENLSHVSILDKLTGESVQSYNTPLVEYPIRFNHNHYDYKVIGKNLLLMCPLGYSTRRVENIYFVDLFTGRVKKTMNLSDVIQYLKYQLNVVSGDITGAYMYSADNMLIYTFSSESVSAIICFDFKGELMWKLKDNGDFRHSELFKDNKMYVIGKNKIHQVNLFSGKIEKIMQINNSSVLIPRPATGEKSWQIRNCLGYKDIYFDLENGRVIKVKNPACYKPEFEDNYIYMTQYDVEKGVSAVDGCAKVEKWRFKPSDKEDDGYFEVVYYDNNYLLVKSRQFYYAIGEKALSDYLKRRKAAE